MNVTIVIICVCVALAVYFGVKWMRGKAKANSNVTHPFDADAAIIATLTVETPAVAGVFPRVFSQKPLGWFQKQGIIDGFVERTITAKDKFGWTLGMDPAKYTIYVYPNAGLAADGTPAFKVFLPPGDPYIGSEFDKGGYILAAERVLTKGVEPTNEFIIADSEDQAYTARVTSYALDHIFLWFNDRDKYFATMTHANGGGHPLW